MRSNKNWNKKISLSRLTLLTNSHTYVDVRCFFDASFYSLKYYLYPVNGVNGRDTGTAPAYLTDELCQVADVEARQRLRSSSSSSLIVSRTRLSTIGDRAFPVAAACVWNSLPDLVTSAPFVAVFRSRLTTHLFNISYPSPLWLYSACAVTLSCFGHYNRSCLLTCCFHSMCVCVCVHSRSVNQTSFKRLKLQTSNLMFIFPGTVRTWPLKFFWKGAWPGSCEPLNFWALSGNSSKTVKATDFKFDVHVSIDSW